MLAPIVLFVYNRPRHTRQTLESLNKNNLADQSDLFIYADGPKENTSEADMEKIRKTREVIREKQWCGKVHLIERDKNNGLANSVKSGVADMMDKFGKAIILEDDLITSKHFLEYMNDALERYGREERIMQVSGYMYPIALQTQNDAVFLPFITSWGWGTWKRAWDKFDGTGSIFSQLTQDKNLRKKFNLDGAYPYYRMLKTQLEKGIDSWAILFYASVFAQNGLTIFPKKTMVKNIGMDGSGVHCKVEMRQNNIDDGFLVKYYDVMAVRPEILQDIFVFLRNQMKFSSRAVRFIKQYFSRARIKDMLQNCHHRYKTQKNVRKF